MNRWTRTSATLLAGIVIGYVATTLFSRTSQHANAQNLPATAAPANVAPMSEREILLLRQAMLLWDDRERSRAMLALNRRDDGSSNLGLLLFDSKYQARIEMVIDRNDDAGIRVRDKDGKIIWSTPGAPTD